MKIKARIVKGWEANKGFMFVEKDLAEPIAFKFDEDKVRPFHSYFVDFPFLMLFYNKDRLLVDSKLICSQQSSIQAREPFSLVIEIPFNKEYGFLITKWVQLG